MGASSMGRPRQGRIALSLAAGRLRAPCKLVRFKPAPCKPGACKSATLLAASLAAGLLLGGAPALAGQVGAAAGFSQIHMGEADRAALRAPPNRIVSINMCADELALRLARPGTLISISPLALENIGSNVAALARGVPVNRGATEEIAGLKPDLVAAGRYTTRATVALLRRLGVPVADLDVPNSLAGVRDQIREAGVLFHNEAAAKALTARFDALLAAPLPEGRRPTAVVLRPAGFTSSEGSLLDDMLTRAGMRNLAGGPLAGYEQLPLEFVLAAAPELLIIAGDPDSPPALASEFLNHPALRSLKGHTRIVVLPSRLWTCPGPGVLDAMTILRDAVADWRASQTMGDAPPPPLTQEKRAVLEKAGVVAPVKLAAPVVLAAPAPAGARAGR